MRLKSKLVWPWSALVRTKPDLESMVASPCSRVPSRRTTREETASRAGAKKRRLTRGNHVIRPKFRRKPGKCKNKVQPGDPTASGRPNGAIKPVRMGCSARVEEIVGAVCRRESRDQIPRFQIVGTQDVVMVWGGDQRESC